MSDKLKLALTFIFVAVLFTGAVFFAQYIQENSNAQELIASFGYLGILIVSFIGGLNLFVPVPATAFIPVFSAAGFNLWSIIAIIVVGTTIADLVSYYIGAAFKPHAEKSNNRVLRFVREYCTGKPKFTMLIVFLWAAIFPIPNEVLLLPLGTIGFKLKYLVVPFTLGTMIHVTAVAFGLTALI